MNRTSATQPVQPVVSPLAPTIKKVLIGALITGLPVVLFSLVLAAAGIIAVRSGPNDDPLSAIHIVFAVIFSAPVLVGLIVARVGYALRTKAPRVGLLLAAIGLAVNSFTGVMVVSIYSSP